jgi:hypothetical protein
MEKSGIWGARRNVALEQTEVRLRNWSQVTLPRRLVNSHRFNHRVTRRTTTCWGLRAWGSMFTLFQKDRNKRRWVRNFEKWNVDHSNSDLFFQDLLYRKTWLTSRIPLWFDSHDDLWLCAEQVPPIMLIEEWIISSRRIHEISDCVYYSLMRRCLCQGYSSFCSENSRWREWATTPRKDRCGPAKFSKWHSVYLVSYFSISDVKYGRELGKLIRTLANWLTATIK